MADLTIRINGDLKNYEEALEAAQAKTAELNDKLESLSKISAVAFAVLTAEIFESVKAFGESQAAARTLTQALQDQGIYSDELMDKYKKQSEALQNLTGIDNDAIIKSQALLQASMGNIQISENLTKAVLDLSVAKGMDLQTTTELIGKGVEGHTMALKKLGIEVDSHVDKETRVAQIIEQVTLKFGGQAEAANQGLGAIKGLGRAFEDVQKALGERFAPAIEYVIKNMTEFFKEIADNKMLLDLIATLTIAGTGMAAVGIAVGTLGMAFTKFQAIAEAVTVATEAMGLSMKLLAGATGVGLIAIAVAELYMHWETAWPAMQEIFDIFVDNISTLSEGLSKIIKGALHLDSSKMKEGWDEAKEAITESYEEVKQVVSSGEETVTKTKVTQNAARAALAKKEQAQDKLDDAMKVSQMQSLNKTILAEDAAYQKLSSGQKALFLKENQDKLTASLQTEATIQMAYANQRVQEDIKRRNQFLMDEQQFGTSYANIHAVMNSEIYKGTQSAFSDMTQMTNSHNQTLKALGKAASVATITMKTAESAMNVFAGFSTIPIVGPALGMAAAAATIVYGAEQVSNVLGANQGGLVTGGTPGVDSVPAMLSPGELVVPAKNYDEVVGAVSGNRTGGNDLEEKPRNINVTVGFDSRTASQLLTILQVEDSALGISPKGV